MCVTSWDYALLTVQHQQLTEDVNSDKLRQTLGTIVSFPCFIFKANKHESKTTGGRDKSNFAKFMVQSKSARAGREEWCGDEDHMGP